MPVDSTKSQNITLTGRRSHATSMGWTTGLVAIGAAAAVIGPDASTALPTQRSRAQLASMAGRHSDFSKVLIREIRQDGQTDVVLGKSLGVLPESELLQPITDLLHEAAPLIVDLRLPALAIYPRSLERSRRKFLRAAVLPP